jgi:hypothetical protein
MNARSIMSTEDDRLPPTHDDPPTSAASPRRQRCTCEFCECELTPVGDILKFSDKAKGYRKHDQTVEDLQAKIVALETDLREARAKIPAEEPARESQEWNL